MANVRDLLIRMSLDTATFKRNIADAKGELRTLKSEFRAVSSDSNVENAGGKLLENLREQKSTAEALVKEYEKGIREVRTKLNEVPAGSQAASQLQQQVTKLETGLNNAKTSVNEIQTKIDTFRLDNLASAAKQVAGIFSSLRLGFGELLDGFGETADSADEVYVSREKARISGTKSIKDATEKQLADLDKQVKQIIGTDIPAAYEKMYAIIDEAGKNGVSILDIPGFSQVMAKLASATDLSAEVGAETMAQFINLTEKSYDHIENIGSALVALGNNSATSESKILDMAHKAASGLSQVGMKSADILGLSTAIASMGIESMAGGSAVSKLAIKMDEAAKVGAQSGGKLLAAWGDDEIKTVYDLYSTLDQLGTGKGWRPMAEALGMTMSDTKNLMNAALAAERFSQAMGLTTEEFSKGWNENSAESMLRLFTALGSMGGTDLEDNMLWTMDKLGITEIRQSNMVRALSSNWQLYADMLALANQEYEKNIAMDEEAQRAFSTTESQRIINQNKEQNALEAMGQTVTAMRTPWESFFADLKQWFTEWPDWAQAGISAGTEALGKAGELLDALGKFSFNLMNIATAIKEIEKTTIGARILKTLGSAGTAIGSAASVALPGAAFIGGSLELGRQGNLAFTENTFGNFNRNVERASELLDTAGEKATRTQELFQAFADAVNDEDYVPKIQEAWAKYGDELLEMFPELKKDVHDSMDGMDWAILGAHAADSLAQGIDQEKENLYQSALDTGLQVPAGLAQGIYDGAAQVLEAASWLAGQVEEQMRVDLDVHSPSRKMEVLGSYVAQGFARGIENGLARIEGAADRMARAAENTSSGASRHLPLKGKASENAAFIINIDGKAFAQAVAPYVDDALGEAAWP